MGVVIAVLPGVLNDSQVLVWMKLIHSALKTHLNSPAVQVYCISPPLLGHTSYADCSLPLLSTEFGI